MTSSPPAVDIRFEIRLHDTHTGWTRAAYDSIYVERGIRQLDSFYLWILHVLQPAAGRNLLDVACGEGTLAHFGRKHYHLNTYNADLSLSAMQIAQNESQSPSIVSSGEDIPFADNSFDYVTCIGSLEHFLDMRAGVREMARVLRPDGTAFILVPNTYSILGNVYEALKTGRSTIDFQPMQRYAARAEWQMLLEECGLEVFNTVKYEREPPFTLGDGWWYLQHPRALVKLALMPLIPLNWIHHFGFLCRPREKGEL